MASRAWRRLLCLHSDWVMLVCRVGMLFLPNDDKLAAQAKQIVEDVVAAEGRCTIAGWRDVPVDHSIVGRMAKITEPRIVQV